MNRLEQIRKTVDGLEEPPLPEPETQKVGLRWHDMTEVPPIMVVRMKLIGESRT